MSSCYTKQPTMISYNCSAEFRNVFIKIDKVFGLLSIYDIIEMNVFVSPFKVMNDPPVCELLFNYKKTLKELYNVFLNINMTEFRNHC